ncbi:MAG: acetyl-CoA carboxylase carboxyltransferase subunit beta [Planctomycetes bacterium]|nr:acetyl-CoA carboxylase carboxyltransferase subunit beta [Planctomycetota bacterium]
MEKLAKAEKKAKKAGVPPPVVAPEVSDGHADEAGEEPKREGRLARLRFSKKKDMPGGLWLKCESCTQVIFRKELEEKGRVCPSCGFHFTVPGKERIKMTLDEGSWREQFAELEAMDRLSFMDAQPYAEKVRRATERSGQKEALLCGTGSILGRPVVLAVLDFNFMGGSMGEVVGEKIALAAELAVREQRPLVIFTSSGGARMHEGILSLMQMAKTCAALQTLNEHGGFSICVMTHPTTGGVTASFASITDLILAEPGALIGFAGPRVIATTLKQELPPGFQRAEFLLERGMLDAIVKRSEMKAALAKFIDYSKGARVSHGGGALRPKGRP